MKEYVSSVSPKGQITIPIEIREMLGVKPKDKVIFEVGEEGVGRREAAHRPNGRAGPGRAEGRCAGAPDRAGALRAFHLRSGRRPGRDRVLFRRGQQHPPPAR